MKKLFKGILSLSCVALMLGSVTACSFQGPSAYEVAVQNGYQGTEKEWLESLRGSNGKDGEDGTSLTASDLYDTAVENGYTGTFLEFCENVLQVTVQDNNDVDTLAQNMTSVVSIYCGFTKTTYYGGGFIGGVMGGIPQTNPYYSAGSGVVIDLDKGEGDELIVTNYHVIYDASSDSETGISDSIYLYPYGAYNGFSLQSSTNTYADTTKNSIKATYVGGAMDYDIAILRVDDSDYIKTSVMSEAQFASSEEVRVGEKVYAIGNPNGEGISITQGIISVESEYITMTSTDGSSRTVDYRVMRTDAAINGGNSGGALFNAQGGLIGIVNAKNVSSEVDNMGYALPSTQVKNLSENILANYKQNGEHGARVATLGVMVGTTASTAYFDEKGALRIREEFKVVRVVDGGSAAKLLQVNDVFKSIRINDGETFDFTRRYQLLDQLLTVRKGDTVTLGIVRDGMEMTVEIPFTEDGYFTQYQ